MLQMVYGCIRNKRGYYMSVVTPIFTKARVIVFGKDLIKDTTDKRLSAAINIVHHGLFTKPVRPSSGIGMALKNPGCFDPKTHCLTPLGIDCFNKVNADQLGVTADSTVRDFMRAMSSFIKETADENGQVYRSFDTFR